MWKKLPKLTQGLPRPPGGVAAVLWGSDGGPGRPTLSEKREREAAAKAEQRKRQIKEKRLADLRDEFRNESRQGAAETLSKIGKKAIPAALGSRDAGKGSSSAVERAAAGLPQGAAWSHKGHAGAPSQQQQQQRVDNMSEAREQALQAYRLLRAQQGRKQQQQLMVGSRQR